MWVLACNAIQTRSSGYEIVILAIFKKKDLNAPPQAAASLSGTTSYAYNSLDRVISQTPPQGTLNCTYDAADRRTSLTLPNGVVTVYSYDATSQLIGLSYNKGATTLGNLTYSYDAAGRLTNTGGSFARTNLPQAVSTTSYNAANQQTGFGAQTLTYDLNGNLTSDGVNSYTWNARDQLLAISGTDLSAGFAYDAAGRRVSKTINGATTSLLYSGGNVVQEQTGGPPAPIF